MRMTRATEARFLTASGEAMDGKGEEEREVRAWWRWGMRGLGGETMLNGPGLLSTIASYWASVHLVNNVGSQATSNKKMP